MSWNKRNDNVTDKDRKIIDGFYRSQVNLKQSKYRVLYLPGIGRDGVKRTCAICGGSMTGLDYHRKTCNKIGCKGKGSNYYNPNDYIQISPKEIEEQAKKALEIMKQNDKWHEENLKSNKWEETL